MKAPAVLQKSEPENGEDVSESLVPLIRVLAHAMAAEFLQLKEENLHGGVTSRDSEARGDVGTPRSPTRGRAQSRKGEMSGTGDQPLSMSKRRRKS